MAAPKKAVLVFEGRGFRSSTLPLIAFFLGSFCLLSFRKEHSAIGGIRVASVAKPYPDESLEPNLSGLRTVGEIKQRMALPCNYVHDGFYLKDSNEVFAQVYQTISKLEDDIVPIIVECGGHDGITKSLTLKSSRCLGVNTLLIEGSPNNYRTLKNTRPYDWTVNAALCDGDFIEMVENKKNTGETKITQDGSETSDKLVLRTQCTSIDAEIDKLRDQLPPHLQSKIELIHLVLDVEGYEPIAINGIQKYSPRKAMMEENKHEDEDRAKIAKWAKSHGLVGQACSGMDTCYNYDPMVEELEDELKKKLFYGARETFVKMNDWRTSKASKGYMYYGEE